MSNDFKKLMFARLLFRLGLEIQVTVLNWQMYSLTHSLLFQALLGLAEAVPALTLALPAGLAVDRSRPLFIMRAVFAGGLLSALALFLSQQPAFDLGMSAQIIVLYCAAAFSGAARSFSQPATYAFVPRIVAREHLPRASAWMSTMFQTGRVAGPAAGGALLGLFGVAPACGVVCAFMALGLAAMFLISDSAVAPRPIESAAVNAGATQKSSGRGGELLSGARFVFGHPILLAAFSLDMFSVLFGGVTGVLPVYAQDILHVGPGGFGAMQSASAAGALLTSVWLARHAHRAIRARAGSWLFTSVAGFGCCVLIFAVSRNLYLSLAMLALAGAFDSVSVVIRSAAVQLASPDALRGRISAVNSIFIGSSNELGAVESNLAAYLMGIVPSVLFGGAMCLLTGVIVACLAPALRKLDLGKLEADHKISGA